MPTLLADPRAASAARPAVPAARSRPSAKQWIAVHGVDIAAVLGAAAVLAVAGRATVATIGAGAGMALVAVGIGLGLLALRSPVAAIVFVLLASFLRIVPQFQSLPLQPFTMAFAAMVASIAYAALTGRASIPAPGWIELLMAVFLIWNIISAISPHEFEPINSETGQLISTRSFIQTGVLIPFAMFVAGRFLAQRSDAVRTILWAIVAFTGYSALVSILQFTGPKALVWPRFIVDNPGWRGERAVGVFNQPVVNGLVMVIGVVVCVHLATRPGATTRTRVSCAVVSLASMAGIYLTHTRATWLAFVLVLAGAAILSKRMRATMLATLGLITLLVAANWDTLSSGDREAGGVASVNEVEDRLNINATALWGMKEEPLTGWGIGRFQQLNTYYHQQWSPDVNWVRGLGIAAHENELGIGAEVGVPALLVWVTIFVLIIWLLVRAVHPRFTPDVEVRELAAVAALAMGVWLVTGTTVDLRYFEFGGALVMLLAGVGIGTAASVWERERQRTGAST